MIYLIIIFSCMCLIALGNILCHPGNEAWYVYVLAVIIFTIIVVALDGLVAFIIRKLPEKWIHPNKDVYVMGKTEKKFFEAIKVPVWKDKVPELGSFTNFHKDKIENPKDNEYIKRYILEACYGILIHYISSPVSFLIILLDYRMYTQGSYLGLSVGIPVAFVNSILILLPAFILKYNLPKLKTLYQFNLRREKRQNKN